MTITPQDIIDEVQRHMKDTSATMWADADCVEYLNNGLYVLMGARPYAFSAVAAVQLTADVTKQSIPSGDYMLLDIPRNMGTDGSTEGKIITQIDRWQIDLLNQHWHAVKGKSFIEHYSYEPNKNPTDFYVYPKVHATTAVYVEMNTASHPTKVTAANQATTITMDEAYEPFLKEWMFYEVYNKPTSVASYAQSQRHLTNAASLLGMKVQALVDQQQKLKEGA